MVDRVVKGHRFRLMFALAVFSAIGCTTSPPQPSATSSQPVGIVAPNDCRQRIEAAKLDDESTILDVDECRFTLEGEQAATAALAGSLGRDALWAAVWVYGSMARDPAPLLPLLNNSDPSVRVMSAGVVLALGRSEAFPILKASLSEPQFLAGSAPSLPVAQYAAGLLSRFISAGGTPPAADD
jgi:hypothetical protein